MKGYTNCGVCRGTGEHREGGPCDACIWREWYNRSSAQADSLLDNGIAHARELESDGSSICQVTLESDDGCTMCRDCGEVFDEDGDHVCRVDDHEARISRLESEVRLLHNLIRGLRYDVTTFRTHLDAYD